MKKKTQMTLIANITNSVVGKQNLNLSFFSSLGGSLENEFSKNIMEPAKKQMTNVTGDRSRHGNWNNFMDGKVFHITLLDEVVRNSKITRNPMNKQRLAYSI